VVYGKTATDNDYCSKEMPLFKETVTQSQTSSLSPNFSCANCSRKHRKLGKLEKKVGLIFLHIKNNLFVFYKTKRVYVTYKMAAEIKSENKFQRNILNAKLLNDGTFGH
jgi:hypothetical protein